MLTRSIIVSLCNLMHMYVECENKNKEFSPTNVNLNNFDPS